MAAKETEKKSHPEIAWKNLDEFKQAGFSLAPLAGPYNTFYPKDQRGKRPIHNDWMHKALKGQEITPAAFKGKNAGFVIPENIVVVDVDPRNFEGGVDSLDKLYDERGIDVRTQGVVYAETGGGGYHYYFKKPRAVRLVNQLAAYPGIEFKSRGRQVVIPGCTHPSGGVYAWGWDSLGLKDIPDAPGELIALAKRQVITVDDKTVNVDTLKNSPASIQRGREMLELLGPAIEGAGGDNATYRAACTLRDYGLTPEKALELLLEWNETCSPPWDIEDLQVKITNAYNYGQNREGARTPYLEFADESFTDSSNSGDRLELSPEEAQQQQADLWDWRNELQYSARGGLLTSFHNTLLHLRYEDGLCGRIAFNDFIADVVFIKPAPWHDKQDKEHWPLGGRPWSDHDDVHCKAYFNKLDFDPPTSRIREALIEVAKKNRIHPVRDLYSSLEWDGVSRLDTWLVNYCSADDNAYTRAVARKTLVAGCKRVFEPGCKFDYITILEGEQGTGKSTAWRSLAMRDEWFTDAIPDFGSKDMVMVMMGKTIWELAEMANLNRTDANHVKAMVSMCTDRVRLPYQARVIELPRQILLVATSNRAMFIDETGNRRFWPVLTGEIDTVGLRRDAKQLWAEAMHIYRKGTEQLYLDDEQALCIAEEEQENRYIGDDWTETIGAWLDAGGVDEFDTESKEALDRVTGTQIWTECLGRNSSHFDRKAQGRISDVMRKLGWDRKPIRVDGRTIKGYERKHHARRNAR